MNIKELTDEQMAKLRACSTQEEMLELAREQGYELRDDELASTSGGDSSCNDCMVNCWGVCWEIW